MICNRDCWSTPTVKPYALLQKQTRANVPSLSYLSLIPPFSTCLMVVIKTASIYHFTWSLMTIYNFENYIKDLVNLFLKSLSSFISHYTCLPCNVSTCGGSFFHGYACKAMYTRTLCLHVQYERIITSAHYNSHGTITEWNCVNGAYLKRFLDELIITVGPRY